MLYSDQPVLALGLGALLSGTEGLELANFCSSTTRLIQLVASEQPDILLMDLTPEVNVTLLSDLRTAMLPCKIVLWVREIPTQLAFQGLELGVRGILRKTVPAEVAIRCLQTVNEGELWLENGLIDRLVSAKRISLTRRERQLVTLLGQGLNNKELATALLISQGTVKIYLSRLFQKVGVKDRFELALYGLKNPITAQ
jgi:DNA-binding NarL/FixJ family response regulator